MRRHTALSVVMALSLVGCDRTTASIIAPDQSLMAARAAVLQVVPFKSNRYSFRTVGQAPEPGCVAPEARVFLEGEGTATHLGNFTVSFSFCRRIVGTLDAGRGTFTTANGDELHFTFNGVSSFTPPFTVNFTSFATFTGGTGRFDGAAGQASVSGTLDVRTGAGDGRWQGEITSVGGTQD